MKKQQKKKKLKMPKTEKGNLDNFLKIKRAIHLGWKDYFAFAVRMILGAVIIPLFCKLSVGALFELFTPVLWSAKPTLLPFLASVQNAYETFQWLLYAALVSVYWFQCNIRTYNFHFTRLAEKQIRSHHSWDGPLRCPRCGYTMTIKSFSEKGTEKVGERTEYHWEQYRVGKEVRHYSVKEVIPEYRDVEYERQYAMCQSLYCLFEEKHPRGRDYANYKFFEMPYRISDTLHYAVWTKNDTERLTGNLCRYRRGISVFTYLLLTVLIFALSVWRGYDNISFLFRKTALVAASTNLGTCLGIALGIDILIQVVVHISKKGKLSRNAAPLHKNEY